MAGKAVLPEQGLQKGAAPQDDTVSSSAPVRGQQGLLPGAGGDPRAEADPHPPPNPVPKASSCWFVMEA